MKENESKGGGYVGRTMNTSRLNFYDRTLKVSVWSDSANRQSAQFYKLIRLCRERFTAVKDPSPYLIRFVFDSNDAMFLLFKD